MDFARNLQKRVTTFATITISRVCLNCRKRKAEEDNELESPTKKTRRQYDDDESPPRKIRPQRKSTPRAQRSPNLAHTRVSSPRSLRINPTVRTPQRDSPQSQPSPQDGGSATSSTSSNSAPSIDLNDPEMKELLAGMFPDENDKKPAVSTQATQVIHNTHGPPPEQHANSRPNPQPTGNVCPSVSAQPTGPPQSPQPQIKDYPDPTCVSFGGPPADVAEAQRGKIKWIGKEDGWKPEWVDSVPNDAIKKVVGRYLHLLGDGEADGSIRVDLLGKGACNKAYTITTRHRKTGEPMEAVFRVTLPVMPWYKTQSEVATILYVHEHTNIPVPRVYAFDSCSDNPVGYEWILMEKVQGNSYADIHQYLDEEEKLEVHRTVASWMDQLSRLKFDGIGSIYRQWDARKSDFGGYKLGPVVLHEFFHVYKPLEADGPRYHGPFTSMSEYFRAILDSQVREGQHPDTAKEFEKEFPHFNSPWYRETLDVMLPLMNRFHTAITALTGRKPTLGEGECYLKHWDAAGRNIMLNDNKQPIALLDWEFVYTESFEIRQDYPPLIEEAREWFEDNNQEHILEARERVFLDRLSELNSPYLEAMHGDSQLLDLNRSLSHFNAYTLEKFDRRLGDAVRKRMWRM